MLIIELLSGKQSNRKEIEIETKENEGKKYRRHAGKKKSMAFYISNVQTDTFARGRKERIH